MCILVSMLLIRPAAVLMLHFEIDIKPDNVLIDYGNDATRFSRVALGDCGDVHRFNPNLEESHVISAAIFRSPEAQLNLRWGPPTDIWSLGATVRTSVVDYPFR